jgi:D-alanine-D-alanine ligase-like ATP-grasp enzyme
MVDEIDKILKVQDRFSFIAKFNSFMATQPQQIRDLFGTPINFEFTNKGTIDQKVNSYNKQAKQAGLQFPVLIKSKLGSKDKYAHHFFCVTSELGLREALAFEGFDQRELLIQAYASHYEQVYKVYCINEWHSDEIRLSLPEQVLLSKDAFAFDSQKPFEKSDFTEFDPDTNRLSPLTDQFVKAFSRYFGISLYGIDIIVEKSTGKHMIIDCNYLPNYAKVPLATLTSEVDRFLDYVRERPQEEPIADD